MIVRAASSVEAPKLVEILVERQADSRFAGVVNIDQPYARKALAHAIHRHGQTNDGGCFVQVAERPSDGRIEAFIMGMLDRVYGVGDMLVAHDQYLLGRKDADPRALPLLLDGYIAWAENNPRVYETLLTWSDALPSGSRFDGIYERKGFTRSGAIYRRVNVETVLRELA